MHLPDGTDLCHQLGEKVLGEPLVDVSHVDSGVFVLLPAPTSALVLIVPNMGERQCKDGMGEKTNQCFDAMVDEMAEPLCSEFL